VGREGGKVIAMRGRSQETGPEGLREEGLDDQRGPKGGAKGAEEHTGDRQVTNDHHWVIKSWAGELLGGLFRHDLQEPIKQRIKARDLNTPLGDMTSNFLGFVLVSR
jgi:hypothetical protein